MRVGHVFVIVLENEDGAKTFGSGSPAPYLSTTLVAQGAYIPNYYGIGHLSNDNYIAMISGQGPNAMTQSDCQIYSDFQGTGPQAALGGQAVGQGCVFPASVLTVADQLSAAKLTWKGYMEDMGKDPAREAATCGHPAFNTQDQTQSATATDAYATRHNPFVYFHSIIDNPICATNVVSLDPFAQDLATIDSTPNLSFIVPNLCHDGHDSSCASGETPGGLAAADKFLQAIVPMILNSPAFQQDGLLLITFDESSGAQSDASACCGEGPGPNSPLPGISGLGGGVVGMVALSPFIKPGTVSTKDYNHYAMLRSIEDIFGLSHLGYADGAMVSSFGADVCNGLAMGCATH